MITVVDDMRFCDIEETLNKLQSQLYTLEVILSEDEDLMRRQIGFMEEAVIHFRNGLKEHKEISI